MPASTAGPAHDRPARRAHRDHRPHHPVLRPARAAPAAPAARADRALRRRPRGPAGAGQRAVRAGLHAWPRSRSSCTGCRPPPAPTELALHRALLTPVGARAARGAGPRRAGAAGRPRAGRRRAGRAGGLGIITRAGRRPGPAARRQHRSTAGWPCSTRRCRRELWQRAHELIERAHRGAGRGPDDAVPGRGAAALPRPRAPGRRAPTGWPRRSPSSSRSPCSGVVTAFGRAVNRTIRERLG